jgi:hypothetical protein
MQDGIEAPGAVPVKRGCGERVAGGVYSECGLSPNGRPLEDFLIDSPVPVPPSLPITPMGVQLIEREGAWHILDWVGSEHYPNVADFVEEVRRFGMSRRLPKNLDWSKLTPASRHLLVHARAHVSKCTEYAEWTCPKGYNDHAPRKVLSMLTEGVPSPDTALLRVEPCLCCAGFWWRDIEGGDGDEGEVVRRMPSFSYIAHARPATLKPDYWPAFFAAFPISRLVVVAGGDTSVDDLDGAGVPVAEVPR